MILNLSGKSLKSTCKEICILESFFVSMNKIFEIHLWKNTFFQFTILLVIFVIVPNVPLLKCLTLVSVNHLLENLWLFTTCIPRVWRQNNLFPLHIYFNLHIYIYVDIRYMRFCLCKWNWGIDFVFHKTNFENSKNWKAL